MSTATEVQAKKVHVKLEGSNQPVETYLVHRGGKHSRVAVPDKFREQFGVPDGSGTALVSNDQIVEMESGDIEPGHQRGGIPAEERVPSA
jgi:hypothetical protein